MMRRKWLALLVTVLVVMLMTYIFFFAAFAMLVAIFDFILLDGNVDEYILELKDFAVPCVLPSIAVGIRYFIQIFYRF